MSQPSNVPRRLLHVGWQRACTALAVALALAGAFALYQRPDFLVMLADQAWSCF